MKGTKVPYDYASHHPEKKEVKYTREKKEELAIEQEEEDAKIWIIAVLEEEIKAFTQEKLQKGTKEGPKLFKRVYDRLLLTQKRELVPKTLQNKAVTIANGGYKSTAKILGQLRQN